MHPAQNVLYNDIHVGEIVERDYTITPAVYEGFLAAFDDRSPIHIDAAYAKSHGFADRVMHGAILNGFVSHFVGMIFPGAGSLLLSVDLRFSQPSYLNDVLRLTAKVAQKLESQRVIELHIKFHNETRNALAATGKVQVKVRAD